MPADYPKDPEEYGEEEEDEEEEDEEEEDEEEEQEEYDEITPFEELDSLEDGPSTHFVGGFSSWTKLSEAVASAQYIQDRIRVFPGAYTEAMPEKGAPASAVGPVGSDQDVIVLDEMNLRGLTIEGIPYVLATDPARTRKGKAKATRTLLTMQDPAVGRRVGPWFAYFHAALAQRAEGGAAAGPPATMTTMGSSVYGATVTPTELDPHVYPVLSSRLIIRTTESTFTDPSQAVVDDDAPPRGLKMYRQEPDDDDDDEEGEEGEEDDDGRGMHGGQDDNGDDGSDMGSSQAGREKGRPASVSIFGLCFTGGAVLEPLSDSRLRHCVLGAPSILSVDTLTGQPIRRNRTTLAIHPLSEAKIERCVIYGGEGHGIYAYPRAAARVASCLVDGPSLTASISRRVHMRRPERHIPSVLATLEAKARLRATAASSSAALGNGLPSTAADDSSFLTPAKEGVACEAAVFLDDADLRMTDVMIANARLGLLLHDGCRGTHVTACDVRSIAEVGVYAYGVGGVATMTQSTIRACGRECLLVAGPTEDQAAEAEAAYRASAGITEEQMQKQLEKEEDDEDDEEEGDAPRFPTFDQHPIIRSCSIVGAVRLQGLVRAGGCVDNLVLAPALKKTPSTGAASYGAAGSAAAAATTGPSAEELAEELATLVQGPNLGISKTYPTRGFTVVGREGEPRIGAAQDDDDAI